VVAVGGVVVAAGFALADRDPQTASANALLAVVEYAFRPVWLLEAALAVLATGTLVALAWAKHSRGTGGPARAALTGVLTFAIAPVGLALVSALLLAAIGAPTLAAIGDQGWQRAPKPLVCRSPEGNATLRLPAPQGSPGIVLDCLDSQGRLTPERVSPSPAASAPRLSPPRLHCLASSSSWTWDRCAETPTSKGATMPPGSTPRAWSLDLFGDGLVPLIAVFLLAVLVTLAAAAFLSFYLWTLFRHRSAPSQGRWLSFSLASLGGRGSRWVLVAAILVGAASTYALWTALGRTISTIGLIGTAIALSIGGLLVAARFIPVQSPLSSVSGPLEVLRRGFDLVYDVATYLRVSHRVRGGTVVRAPRERMLDRYRALLRHVAAQRYDGVVIAAHSQGSVLSAAALLGDFYREWRGEDEDPGAARAAWEAGRRARHPELEALPPSVSLLTFGCPLLQTYEARFPEQYSWLRDPAERRREVFWPLSVCWLNVYRAGDYIGRSLWRPDASSVGSFEPWPLPAAPQVPSGPRLVDWCIGEGQHTGYWSDPRWVEAVRRLVEHTAAHADAASRAR
jgi:hypothetical protein